MSGIAPESSYDINGVAEPKADDDKEVEAAEKVINALRYYRKYVLVKLKRQAQAASAMSAVDRPLLLPSLPDHLKRVGKCAEQNQKLFDMIVNCGAHMLGNSLVIDEALNITQLRPATEHYMSKVKSTLKQIVRDWSAEGESERKSCYDKVLRTIYEHFPSTMERHKNHVLVAGAGLARFAWELLREGFSVTGNEFSIFMLLTSNFILNTCEKVNEFTIYPYILDCSNSWSYEDQLRPVQFPDVNPTLASRERLNTFAMCAGDFLQAFNTDDSKFDCVVSVFFLDTAVNPIEYIRTIHKILKVGGIWVNYGPLTYHFEGENENSLELPFEEIIRILEAVGFRIDNVERKGKNPPAKYTVNEQSMLHYIYNCGFFKCTKL
ncbi:hypothetical protein Ddc_09428 [Ditylenchus destructor]|nr:hypothetical protein Ddc_09428 [Ditylenchus destructor]